jgi:predicted glycosyltransferase
MNILIDIGHPAHVHLFKNFVWIMKKKGHKTLFTAREKEHTIYLLKKYGLEYRSLGRHYKSKPGKIWGLFKFNLKLLKEALKFKPDILMSHGSMYAAHVSLVQRKPHISLEDTGNMEQIKIYRPFTEVILTPDVLEKNLGPKQIRYKGYHELCYLLPNYFNPDNSIYKLLGIEPEQKYCIFRFVSWRATHDKGQVGLTFEQKKRLIEQLSRYLKVFITSESDLPEEFSKYQIKIPPEKIHDALSFANLFIGEGATMASESGVLGTPSIYVNSIVTYNNEDQEKYGLVFNFRDDPGVLGKALELLQIPDIKEEWKKRRKRMLADKIDVTAFLVWFIENYPGSVEIMKKNPDYQYRFK